MANIKITDLPELTDPVASDLVEAVDDTGGTPTSKKLTITNLQAATHTQDSDHGGKYIINEQGRVDDQADGASYFFDGVDDVITVADDPDIDVTIGDFSILTNFTPITLDANSGIVEKRQDSSNNWHLRYNASGIVDFFVEVGNIAKGDYRSDSILMAGRAVNLAFISDRDGGTSGQLLFMNGVPQALTEFTAMSTDSFANTGNVGIGKQSTANFSNMALGWYLLFNLALDPTDPTDKAIINGGPVQFKYLGASQTDLTSGTLIIGKEYIIDAYVAGDDFTNVGGTNVTGDVFVATGTTPTVWANSSSLRHQGQVASYLPEGITDTTWYDSSGNANDGTVSGSIAINDTGIASSKTSIATETGLLLYDVDNDTYERVTVGISDSGGAGFKVLRIPN